MKLTILTSLRNSNYFVFLFINLSILQSHSLEINHGPDVITRLCLKSLLRKNAYPSYTQVFRGQRIYFGIIFGFRQAASSQTYTRKFFCDSPIAYATHIKKTSKYKTLILVCKIMAFYFTPNTQIFSEKKQQHYQCYSLHS